MMTSLSRPDGIDVRWWEKLTILGYESRLYRVRFDAIDLTERFTACAMQSVGVRCVLPRTPYAVARECVFLTPKVAVLLIFSRQP